MFTLVLRHSYARKVAHVKNKPVIFRQLVDM